MSYGFSGFALIIMIITKDFEIAKKGKNKGQIKQTSLVECKCDRCGKIFKRYYHNVLNNDKYCLSCTASVRISNYNKSVDGLSFDERFGEEKSKVVKSKLSAKMKERRRNGDLKDATWTSYNKKQIGKTWEERFGEDRAAEIKRKLSLSVSGEKNPMFGKPAPSGSGNGWSGWYKDFYFRSLMELSFLVRNENLKLKSAEGMSIKYSNFAGTIRSYHPDFICDNVIFEIKPKHLCGAVDNKLKFAAAEKWCKENGFLFKVLTEDNIERLSFDEIKKLHDANEIKFLDRYELKYKEFIYDRSI